MTGVQPRLLRKPRLWARQIVSTAASTRTPTDTSVNMNSKVMKHWFIWVHWNWLAAQRGYNLAVRWHKTTLEHVMCIAIMIKIFSGCLPQTRHARDSLKKGSSVYISAKLWGCRGSHCSTARLADTYRAVALTGFIAVCSAASRRNGPGKKIQPPAATELKIAKSQGGWRKYKLAWRSNNQSLQCVNAGTWINNTHNNRQRTCWSGYH